jgi:hypothetical protein
MNDERHVDLFAEDRGHEEFLKPLISRIARQENCRVSIKVRTARGGHGRAVREFKLYQKSVLGAVADLTMPDILVVAIDSNCKSYVDTTNDIKRDLEVEFSTIAVLACPDPHIELWYLADLDTFEKVVGYRPTVPSGKCVTNYYKNLLSSAVTAAGHPATLGGIEFARELVQQMDLFRAGQKDAALKHLIQDLENAFRRR